MSEPTVNLDPTPADSKRLEKTLQSPNELWSDPAGDAAVYRFIRKIRNEWHLVSARDCGDDLEILGELTLDSVRAMHEHRIGTRLVLG
jgi:hypothetical protein